MFGSFKLWSIVGFALLAAAIIGYFYWSQNKIENLAAQSVAFQSALEQQQQEFREMEAVVEASREERQRLQNRFNDIEASANELERLLSEHDLGNLAEERPGLIETRVNDATRELLREFELLTDPNTIIENQEDE